MCVDYRTLNKTTIKNRFLVSRIEDIFDKLQGSTYYSRIDLKSGYHQIRIVPKDIHKIAFRTQFHLYEYLVMPFGLTNAPAMFNRLMDRIFRKHRSYTSVFFDDIIVHSKTVEEHKEHLAQVFKELREHKAYTGVFFDNIIVHSKTLEEHKDHIAQVFKELQEHKRFVNSKKSENGPR